MSIEEIMNEYNRRCRKAVDELSALGLSYLKSNNIGEYRRINGKVEGVQLAQSYINELIKLLESVKNETTKEN